MGLKGLKEKFRRKGGAISELVGGEVRPRKAAIIQRKTSQVKKKRSDGRPCADRKDTNWIEVENPGKVGQGLKELCIPLRGDEILKVGL